MFIKASLFVETIDAGRSPITSVGVTTVKEALNEADKMKEEFGNVEIFLRVSHEVPEGSGIYYETHFKL